MKWYPLYIILLLVLLNSCGVKKSLEDRPDITGIELIDTLRIKHNDSLYSIGKNSLFKNKHGIWELYVEGDALERGLVTGSLTRELMHIQERAIMDKIESLVPTGGYQNFLRKVITYFNRKMHLHIPEEYKAEIYGVSRFALPDYNSFAAPYVRSLYLHGAHDIGHALQDLMLVGCTSFAAWDAKTEDGDLILGRNFDFFINEEFAEEKIAAFVNPDQGHKFMMYTWGGMIGVVSGMNEKGLTVTINAGKSRIPLAAKTPISLVAREILQYAATTREAIEIARKREVFVSEAIMIGSAQDQKAVIIEVSPNNFGVYEVDNSSQLICSNHFQSDTYTGDRRNQKAQEESHTTYRFALMEELMDSHDKLDPEKAAQILRTTVGLDGEHIGWGNEKSINQLLAHHGVIFKPSEKKVWVSANPYQLGAFVAYDLDSAFENFINGKGSSGVSLDKEIIPASEFIASPAYKNFQAYRELTTEILSKKYQIGEDKILQMLALNPNLWKAWAIAGEYYYIQKDYKKALIYFKQAQKREVSSLPEARQIEKMIKKSYRKF